MLMLLADTSLSLDPAWPWSLPTLGLPAVLGAALLLTLLTVWTYLGVKNATWRRVSLVLLLRLAALLLVFGMMMRPSFAVTQLEGVEITKLLVLVDASESMNAVEIDGKPSRWDEFTKLWASRDVQRRLDQLRAEQKIEVVKYLAAEDLRPDDPAAAATGKRTDMGVWLHRLRERHGHEKQLRGIVVIGDGADNGVKFSASQEAGKWRGIAPIHAFGVGDPANPKFRKDIGLTKLEVRPDLVFVKSNITIDATAQAAGYKDTEVSVSVVFERVPDKKGHSVPDTKLRIKQEKNQKIEIPCQAPDEPGEYKLTLTIAPQPDEVNKNNNSISTFVQVAKEKINVLWVDRRRVYEAIQAIRLALAPEQRFEVHYFEPPSEPQDPIAFYEFDQRHYDVIVIGDISAKHFALGEPKKVFDRIDKLVREKTGLLMLGGSETFVKGGWHQHKTILDLLPVKLDVPLEKAEFVEEDIRATRVKSNLGHELLKLDPDPVRNDKIWQEYFDRLAGFTPVGSMVEGSTPLLQTKKDQPNKEPSQRDLLMAATQVGTGRIVVFTGDSTEKSWLTPKSADAYKRFWKQLVFWLAQQQDLSNQLWVKLDRRRINANAGEVLGFTFGLRGKQGEEVPGAVYTAKVMGPDNREQPVSFQREQQRQAGSFQGAKLEGDYQFVVTANAKDGEVPIDAKTVARFLVAFDDIEMMRPVAEHETLAKIAANGEGRFQVLDEASLLAYLDGLKSQVNRESRHKTTHWPDWKRLPPSDHARDQLAGLWNSFALVSLLLFVTLLGSEWLLRRWWGLI